MDQREASRDRERLDDTYARLWEAGGPIPDIIAFLKTHPDAPARERADVLLVDQRYRWKNGECRPAERYFHDFPEVAIDPELKFDLVYGEIHLDLECGGRPDLDRLVSRFPDLHDALTCQMEVGNWLQEAEGRPEDDDSDLSLSGFMPCEGSGRFILRRELGAGGMGIVYEAFDRQRQERVALKTMRQASSADLYRFKREFRSLADVAHPNLATLFELFSWSRQTFFTMELIDGVSFIRYVRSGPPLPTLHEAGAGPCSGRMEQDSEIPDTEKSALASDPAAPAGPARNLSVELLSRLRDTLRQLVDGTSALHESGKLHRDIKPNNVLVTRSGRVVLLDFGLATELEATGFQQGSELQAAGTAAYMAPEQAASQPVSPASDWYSVGVMLYEALTGRLPFVGRPLEVFMDKQRLEPPPPRTLIPEIPEDLDALCVDLLRRDPCARPSRAEIVARLGGRLSVSSPPSRFSPPHLVGRHRHLQALNEAVGDVRGGETVTVFIEGKAGVGKTALVRHFLDGLRQRSDTVILAGRCYERESVPYKALDGLIDDLSRHLRRLPPLSAQALLPRDVGPLAQVFPVLQQADVVASAPRRVSEVQDPPEMRRRAFAALRELLARLGDRTLLVLFVDDLQWGDTDSAALLAHLLSPPDPPILLLLGCSRNEDAKVSTDLSRLLGVGDHSATIPNRRTMTVEELTSRDAERLASEVLGSDDPATRGLARALARESGGNPFFLTELVRAVSSGTGEVRDWLPPAHPTLDEILSGRIARLPESARRLLEVIAVSGRPLKQAIAMRAADCGTEGRTALAALGSGRLVRSTGRPDSDEVETYHDRVRETVVTHLDPVVLESHHRSLARELLATGQAEPEQLAAHYLNANEPNRAGLYFQEAAEQAERSLAFERAAVLYGLALELLCPAGDDRRRLRVRLGDALAIAGRGSDAAAQYLKAVDGAQAAEALELSRRAAYQLCISGHFDEGRAAFEAVLGDVGVRLPTTSRGALLSLALGRAILRLRGLRTRRREASLTPPFELARIDITWSAAVGLTMIDTIRGANIQTRNLTLALRAGEPYRLSLALAWEATHLATLGVRVHRRVADLLARAEALTARDNHPHALGLVTMATGIAAYFQGRWAKARRLCDQAEETLRSRCTGVAGEIATARSFALWSLYFIGDVAELRTRLPVLLKEARGRGDLLAEASFSNLAGTLVWLAADDPEGARRALQDAMAQWSQREFLTQHFTRLAGDVMIDLYQGAGHAARDRLRVHWPALRRSLLLNIEGIRILMRFFRARSALAAAAADRQPRPLLREAARDARRIARERSPWARPMALLLRAAVQEARGDVTGAAAAFGTAATAFDALDMRLFSALARRQQGGLVRDDEGKNLVAQTDAWMASQRIIAPHRMAALYVSDLSGVQSG